MNEYSVQPRSERSVLVLGGRPLDAQRRLEFSSRTLSMRHFWELYGEELPLVAVVRVGFHGDHGFDVFSAEEVLWVATSRSQRRVVARDLLHGSQYVSMPLDYPMDVQLLDNEGKVVGVPCCLGSVLSRHQLPVTVRVVTRSSFSFYVAADQVTETSFTDLQLIQTYDDRYLLAHSIVDSNIYWDPSVLPVYLPVTLSTVIGPRDVDIATWRQFCHQVQQECANCDYSTLPMNNDIMVFSRSDIERNEGIYDYIEPQSLIKYQETLKIPGKVKGTPANMKSIHENIAAKAKKKGNSTKYKPGERPKKPGRYNSVDNKERQLPPIPGTRESVQRGNFYEDVKDGEYVDVDVRRDEPRYTTTADDQAPARQLMKELHAKIDRPDSKYEAIRVLEETQHKYESPHANPATSGEKQIQPSLRGTDVKIRDDQVNPLQTSSVAASHHHVLSSTALSAPKTTITSLSNVPEDISGLSVSEVIECLRLMKLDSLVDGFEKQQVNGALFKVMEPQDLREEFCVSNFVAKKACMFARGEWRPDTGSQA